MRSRCLRCLRPTSFCCCRELVPAASSTRVVILQHPREARLAICSAWLAHIALANSELHRGVVFETHARVQSIVRAPGTALLFPGDGAAAAATLGDRPAALIVIDGTWPQALRMLRDNPSIAALPRIAVHPAAPGAYGALRREPGAGHLSTIEAIAIALGAFERDPARFQPMCDAFRRTVELQLACARGPSRRPRHRPGWADGKAATRPEDA